jgi:hypothetical protein
MTMPDFQTIMLPLLKFCADEKEQRIGKQLIIWPRNSIYQTQSERNYCQAEDKLYLIPDSMVTCPFENG